MFSVSARDLRAMRRAQRRTAELERIARENFPRGTAQQTSLIDASGESASFDVNAEEGDESPHLVGRLDDVVQEEVRALMLTTDDLMQDSHINEHAYNQLCVHMKHIFEAETKSRNWNRWHMAFEMMMRNPTCARMLPEDIPWETPEFLYSLLVVLKRHPDVTTRASLKTLWIRIVATFFCDTCCAIKLRDYIAVVMELHPKGLEEVCAHLSGIERLQSVLCDLDVLEAVVSTCPQVIRSFACVTRLGAWGPSQDKVAMQAAYENANESMWQNHAFTSAYNQIVTRVRANESKCKEQCKCL